MGTEKSSLRWITENLNWSESPTSPIKGMYLQNFKSFGTEELSYIPLRSKTLIFGKNNAGKSTIIEAIQLINQTFDSKHSQKSGGPGILKLNAGNGLDLGTFEELVHRPVMKSGDAPITNVLKPIVIGFEIDLGLANDETVKNHVGRGSLNFFSDDKPGFLRKRSPDVHDLIFSQNNALSLLRLPHALPKFAVLFHFARSKEISDAVLQRVEICHSESISQQQDIDRQNGKSELVTTTKKDKPLRVHKLAKELGVSSKDVIEICKAIGDTKIENHLSPVSSEVENLVRRVHANRFNFSVDLRRNQRETYDLKVHNWARCEIMTASLLSWAADNPWVPHGDSNHDLKLEDAFSELNSITKWRSLTEDLAKELDATFHVILLLEIFSDSLKDDTRARFEDRLCAVSAEKRRLIVQQLEAYGFSFESMKATWLFSIENLNHFQRLELIQLYAVMNPEKMPFPLQISKALTEHYAQQDLDEIDYENTMELLTGSDVYKSHLVYTCIVNNALDPAENELTPFDQLDLIDLEPGLTFNHPHEMFEDNRVNDDPLGPNAALREALTHPLRLVQCLCREIGLALGTHPLIGMDRLRADDFGSAMFSMKMAGIDGIPDISRPVSMKLESDLIVLEATRHHPKDLYEPNDPLPYQEKHEDKVNEFLALLDLDVHVDTHQIGRYKQVAISRGFAGLGTLNMLGAGVGQHSTVAQVGTGTTQLLPILDALADGVHNFLCIKEPESNLHPGLQCRLMCLMAATKNFVAETHSENMVLTLLSLIRRGEVSNESVGIIYVDHVNGKSAITDLSPTEDGKFSNEWPHGFFPEKIEIMDLS